MAVTIEVVRYEPKMGDELAQAYNGIIQRVPHYCDPVSGEEFAAGVAGTASGGMDLVQLHSREAFVARDGPTPLGFIDVGIGQPEELDEVQQGIIRFCWYECGHRRAGQALLEAEEDYFRQHGMTQVTAFHKRYRYPFYHFPYAWLSDRLDQVHALLQFNGYERAAGEAFMDWPDYPAITPTPSAVDCEVVVEWLEGAGTRPGLIVRATVGGEEVGLCRGASSGEFSRAADAQDWWFVKWVAVSEQLQGKGLGKQLLQRALQEMRGVGYRHVTISTSWHNYRAFLFYTNMGFHVVDWTYGLQKRNLH